MTRHYMMHYLPTVDEAAIDGVLADWQVRHPKLGVCALLPEAYKAGVAVLQAVCVRRNIPLVGGIFPELVRDGEFCKGGVWLLCFAEMPYFALYADLPTDPAGVERVAGEMNAGIRAQLDHTPNITLFLLFDAMVPNIGTLLDYLYLSLANRVHYAGGNAGSETFQPLPCLFDGQRTVQNGVLLMLLKNHHGAILEHGYREPAETVYATATLGNRISQIDWRPAFEVYQELVRAHYGVEITPGNFYQYAVHFPFGILRANHHVVVRIPVMLAEDGSLFCVGEVPSNSLLTLLKAPAVDSNETMRVLTEGLATLNGGPVGAELLLLYCAGRRMHLGMEAATAELREFVKRTRALQVAGAVSLGEIGGSTVNGYPLFHNATLVASRWHKE
ncbi:MAG: FIST C-terminal domain-containing protein [Nitrosomonadales bacterium]|nr:FIST C-terminal domain-containing protein [Nitrosomonadales bacterium]